MTTYRDRGDAGRQLAELLVDHDLVDPIVLGLPRGGVPVAFEVAMRLLAPLTVFVARKIGAPGQPEYGIGALAEGDGLVFDERAVRATRLTDAARAGLVATARAEVAHAVHVFRHDEPIPSIERRDVILVDDGLATGVTAEAALVSLRRQHPARLILAVPVGAGQTIERLAVAAIVDELVCPLVPPGFFAVGSWYRNFTQTTDAEVLSSLRAARTPHPFRP